PALPSRVTPDAAASTASCPASLDDPERPSVGQDGGTMQVIWDERQEQFLKIGILVRLMLQDG
ncbi:hypothetical protein, partial [Bradyrhizobium sp.]|uniref:hypothetical protein n=1 Tax=Bradyrhizobium sp. TaxID=376 RepID=UPI003C336B44